MVAGPILDPLSFQSHAGSIEALGFESEPTISRSRFNPTLVRLRRKTGGADGGLKRCFNPTLVRLRPPARGIVCHVRISCFNPTLGRLRP